MLKKIIVLILLIILLIFVSTEITNDIEIYNEINNTIQISDEKINEDSIKELQEKYNNTDIQAIISIKDTEFKYPVVQTTNNEYYLNHDLYKKEDILGSVFLDYRFNIEESKKNIIYGHNNTNKNMPFSYLENYYNKEFYEKYPYIEIQTSNSKKEYVIFSVYVENENWDYMNGEYTTQEEWKEHYRKIKQKSMYDTGIEINENDNIIILQTCSELKEYTNYKDKYLLVIAKELREERK